MSDPTRESTRETETPLTDIHIALSQVVEQLQHLEPGSLPVDTAGLFGIYIAQAGAAISKATRRHG